MTTITEFLIARLDEDESAARSAFEQAWIEDSPTTSWFATYHPLASHPIVGAWPARALADVAAKRAIISGAPSGTPDDDLSTGMELQYDDTLRHLASAYAGHPEYERYKRAWGIS